MHLMRLTKFAPACLLALLVACPLASVAAAAPGWVGSQSFSLPRAHSSSAPTSVNETGELEKENSSGTAIDEKGIGKSTFHCSVIMEMTLSGTLVTAKYTCGILWCLADFAYCIGADVESFDSSDRGGGYPVDLADVVDLEEAVEQCLVDAAARDDEVPSDVVVSDIGFMCLQELGELVDAREGAGVGAGVPQLDVDRGVTLPSGQGVHGEPPPDSVRRGDRIESLDVADLGVAEPSGGAERPDPREELGEVLL